MLDNQRRLVAPDWTSAIDCLCAGLCVGMLPAHLAQPFPQSACCLTWEHQNPSPALAWLLAYLGDSESLNQEWLGG
jgi:DNA-binding transcriptional LysR family regulator